MTTVWLITGICLLAPLLVAVVAAGRLSVAWRLVAVELTTSLCIVLLIVLSFAFDQASSIDLALTLALFTLPGTLLFAVFQERWL